MLFDDPATLQPSDVLCWVEICKSGLLHEEQESYRVLGAGEVPRSWLVTALGVGASSRDIADYFAASKQELELAAILALTAAAEARIRQDAELRMLPKYQDWLAKRLRVLRASVHMAWTVPLYDEGIIEAWKSYVNSLTDMAIADRARLLTAIGRFRNLLSVRHWVAHGRYWQLSWASDLWSAALAAAVIESLYYALQRAAAHCDLMAFAE